MKRGMSTIVTSLIFILIGFIAIGLVWGVVEKVLDKGIEEITLDSLTLDLKIQNVEFVGNEIHISVKRNPGAGEINGIRLIVFDGTNSEIIDEENIVLNELNQIFIIKTYNGDVANIKRISIAPIFRTSTNELQIGEIKDFVEFSSETFLPLLTCEDDSDCPGSILNSKECEGSDLYAFYYDYSCEENICIKGDLREELEESCEVLCFEDACHLCSLEEINYLKEKFDFIEQNLNYYNRDDSQRITESAILWLGWTQTDTMKAYTEMYRATKEVYYLQRLVLNADKIITWRDDNYRDAIRPNGIRNYDGKILKTWTFNQWSSSWLQVTFEQTTGTITYPMLDFVKIIYENPSLWNLELADGMTMKEKADFYLQVCKEAVAEHDFEWEEYGDEGYYVIQDFNPESTECIGGDISCVAWERVFIDEDEGYLVCPENTAPIPYERSCVPINQQALIMKSIIRLYELTEEQQYFDKMQKHAQFFKNRFDYDEGEDLYVTNHNCDGIEPGLFSGWSDITRCPQVRTALSGVESLNYWGIVVEELAMLHDNNAGITDLDMQRLANTFTKKIYLGQTDYLSFVVDGSGSKKDIRAVPGLFRLIESNESIYPILKGFYLNGYNNPYSFMDPDIYIGFNYYKEPSSLLGYARSINYCNYEEEE